MYMKNEKAENPCSMGISTRGGGGGDRLNSPTG